MQVWNVLHAARWKFRTQKWRKKSPSGYHRTTLSGYIFATKVCIDNRKKKFVKQQYLLHVSSQYGELSPTSGWDRFVSLGHTSKFQRLSRLDSVTARHSSSGRQPHFAALSRGCHLYSAGRPSRWALAHILVILLSQHFCEPFHFILKGCTDINVYCWKNCSFIGSLCRLLYIGSWQDESGQWCYQNFFITLCALSVADRRNAICLISH